MANLRELPSSIRDWGRMVVAEELDASTLRNIPGPVSGSSINQRQHLFLRTLFELHNAEDFDITHWVPESSVRSARDMLHGRLDWKAYLKHVGTLRHMHQGRNRKSMAELAKLKAFAHVACLVEEIFDVKPPGINMEETLLKVKFETSPAVTRSATARLAAMQNPLYTPSKPPYAQSSRRGAAGMYMEHDPRWSSPQSVDDISEGLANMGLEGTPQTQSSVAFSPRSPLSGDEVAVAADEQVVNSALVFLLNAVTAMNDRMGIYWSLHRRRCKATGFVACTDGYLQHHGGNITEGPLALIETKRGGSLTPATVRQTGAEMAAWISRHPFEGLLPQMPHMGDRIYEKRRFRVLQNGREIYLIIGEYGDLYEQYVCNGAVIPGGPEESFLVLHYVGPFLINHELNMTEFGRAVLALTHAVQTESRPAPARGIWRR